MKMKTLACAVACMAIVIACGTLLAAQNPAMAIANPAKVIHPMQLNNQCMDTALTGCINNTLRTIVSTLGTTYQNNGWLVMADGNYLYGYYEDIALPFTPAKDATATEIVIALTYWWPYGFNGGTVALYSADSSGLPGNSLAAADLVNLPGFGSCCTLAFANLGTGVKLKANTQYFVVGTTNSNDVATIDVWNYSNSGCPTGDSHQGIAFRDGGGTPNWTWYNGVPCSAFGVFSYF